MTRTMRILFVTGAASVHSERWVSFFADRGHDVTWVSLGEPPTRAYESLRFVELPRHHSAPLRPLSYARALRKLVREVQPHVVHAHQVWIDAIVAAASGFHPLVVTPWGSDVLLAPKSRLKRPLISWALRRADLVTCDGENTAQAISTLGVPRPEIELVYFGTNVDRFTPEHSGTGARSRLELGTRPVVLSLRSLRPLYDIETVVRSVPGVLEACPDAAYVIAGDGAKRAELVALAEALGVTEAVHFVGQVNESDVLDLMAAADVYVSTALSDSGLAASTAEAMACGLPVVVTDTGSVRDWIDDRVNGDIIPIQSPGVLADRISDLLLDGPRREAWGAMNRRIIVERNNYGLEMTRMEELYLRVSEPPVAWSEP